MLKARRARLSVVPTLAALALALAACGGGNGDDETGATDQQASESFRAALDQTCVESATEVNDVVETFGVPQEFEDSADFEAARAETARNQAEAAAVLEPPTELEADYESFLESLQEYATVYEQIAELAASGDRTAYEEAVQRRGQIGNEQIAAAARLELEACARRLSPAQDLALREVTERVLTGADPELSCDQDVTEQLQRNNLGRGDRCVRTLEQLAADGSSIEYLFSTGVDGVLASANVDIATVAGEQPAYVIYDFIWDKQSERWLIDSVIETGEPAPAALPAPVAEGAEA